MQKENKQKIKSKKVLEIVSFGAVFLFFICSLLCLIARLNGARFDLFGNRYDVVLTNSMSYKNEKYKDFLENDNNQFQAFDLAISKPLPAPEKLKVHDVVIYTDRYIGTNMHRIVEINENYCERIDFSSSIKSEYNGFNGIKLSNIESNIVTNEISFKTLTLTTYSTLENVNNFNFFAMTELFTPEINRVPVNSIYGGYITTYKITRNTSAPGIIKISHNSIYEYSNEIITSLQIDSLNGKINLVDSSVTVDEETGNLVGKFNCDFSYKTRGDASKDDDGWYRYKELQAIVVGNAKGMGYPIRFMGSIWGGLMFGLLGLLILAFDIISGILEKKNSARTSENMQNIAEKQTIADIPAETPKDKPMKQADENKVDKND